MSDLSTENREKAKKLWDQIVQIRAEHTGLDMHTLINETAKGLYALLPSDPATIQTLIVSHMKLK